MAGAASERIRWAVETLDVEPDDRILEIGCGHGVAVSLVCERLTGGSITAIDRSAKMAEMARKRNAECIARGKALVHPVAFLETDFDAQCFDKIFAIHVGFFWQRPGRELGMIGDLLASGGALYLFFQPLVPAEIPNLIDQAVGIFAGGGITIVRTVTKAIDGGPMACVIGQNVPPNRVIQRSGAAPIGGVR